MTKQLNIDQIKRIKELLILVSVLLFLCQGWAGNQTVAAAKHSPAEQEQLKNNLRGNGLRFTPNKGQVADMNGKVCPDVLYRAEGRGVDVYLRKTGISYVYTNMSEVMHEVEEQMEKLKKETPAVHDEANGQELIQKQMLKIHRVDMDFVNSNTDISAISEEEIEGFQNYYFAYCPDGVTNVKQYHKVTVKNIYNNIDINYYGDKENGLKYNIIVNPHADPNQIKLYWKGAESIRISRERNLIIKTSVNEFLETMPKVYQNVKGKIIDVKARYVLNKTTVNFKLDTWNPDYPLIIDPWVSYYGGSSWEVGGSVTTDLSGNVAFAGLTRSIDLPVSAGAFQTIFGGGGVGVFDVFVVEMTATGSPLWATYLGGSASEGNNNSATGPGIAADNLGNILVAGTTSSANFPVGASAGNIVHQAVSGGAFLFKFSPTGTRLWGTYYNGNGYDVATDGSNIYLYGSTGSTTGISTAGVFQVALNGTVGADVYVAKFASNGSRIWGTYVGGSSTETWGNGGITYDPVTTSVYISGITYSANFPVSAGCHQPVHGGGLYDAFLFKLSSDGTTRLWATFYGGTGQEYNSCINTCDGLGNVILSGVTNSNNGISSVGAYQVTNGGGSINIDSYLVKFNSSGVRQWGTYFGGNVNEYVWGITTDSNNNIYIAGDFEDQGRGNYPVSPCAYQTVFGGGPVNEIEDQYIAKYDSNGKQRCITYMGGSLEDDADNFAGTIAIYGNVLYLTGYTRGNYPVTIGAYQTVFGGVYDVFIAQLCINLCEAKLLGLNYSASTTAVCTNAPVTFTPTVSNSCDTSGYKFQWIFIGGNPASSVVINPTVTYPAAGNYSIQLTLTTACKKDSVIKTSYITVTSCGGITAMATGASMCSGGCATVSASSSNGAAPYAYSWNTGASTQNINPCPATTTTYTVTITDTGGNTAISTATVTVNPSVGITTAPTNITCNGGTNGSVLANPSGGTPSYTFNWSNGQTAQTATNLIAGNYTVTITDAKGCTATTTAIIISPPPLVGQFIKGIANCAGCGCKQWIMATAMGGTSPYSYTWPGGYDKRYKNNLCPGSYIIIIKDKNGCSVNINLTMP